MSLKEKLKSSWQNTKAEWKASSRRKEELAKKEKEAYYAEKQKQAEVVGKARAKIETKRRLKEMRTPRNFGYQTGPFFSSGLFGEPVRRSKKRATHRKKTSSLYIDGHRISSKPPSTRRKVHRRKKKSYGLFDDSLF